MTANESAREEAGKLLMELRYNDAISARDMLVERLQAERKATLESAIEACESLMERDPKDDEDFGYIHGVQECVRVLKAYAEHEKERKHDG